MSKFSRPLELTLLVCLALSQRAAAAGDTALGAVETFFEAMAANDWELASSVMIDDAVLYGYRIEAGQVTLSRTTVAEYLKSMSGREDRLLERIWDIEVLEQDGLASVWAPYDFYLNGKFHHCGTNSFNLIREDSGWRIAGVVYSMLTETCKPSPLGPPKFD